MKVLFRVDASQKMGTGHICRSLALAHALRAQGQDVAFVTRALGLDSKGVVESEGFRVIATLPAPVSGAFTPDPTIPNSEWGEVPQDQDAAETVMVARRWSPDWVVMDSYAFDARWHRDVARGLGCAIAAIDDLADRTLDCNRVIDHTEASDHRQKYRDVIDTAGTRVLGGPRFGLLSPAYARAERYALSDAVRSIGVFMGGVDAGGHSLTALQAIEAAGFKGPVEVVSTSANPKLATLRQAVLARPNSKLSLDRPDLADFFARHDVQIGAGGGASWERCCIGVPTLLVVVADNQKPFAEALSAKGVATLAEEPTTTAMAEALSRLLEDTGKRRSLAANARALVDGRGAERVALALAARTLRVRPARRGDARFMFDWRNDPATRAVSIQNEPLSWEEHLAWLKQALRDPNRALFVGEIGQRSVGVIRFDFEASRPPLNRAEVSLYCDPDLRGLSIGPALLHAGEEAADPAVVEACIMEGNAASQRLFAKAGYRQTEPTRWEKHRETARSDASPAPSRCLAATPGR
ncbi:MAG: UDP-2,4-diacetamido-2,4,6-trideoxy-beta-L-altropyranose hydrolase [Pseudomonadota bacterium]